MSMKSPENTIGYLMEEKDITSIEVLERGYDVLTKADNDDQVIDPKRMNHNILYIFNYENFIWGVHRDQRGCIMYKIDMSNFPKSDDQYSIKAELKNIHAFRL